MPAHDPQIDLEYACKELDLTAARRALSEGANPTLTGGDGLPLLIAALIAREEDDLAHVMGLRADLAAVLIESGGTADDFYIEPEFDTYLVPIGLAAEGTLRAFVDPKGVSAGLRLIATLLTAGASPAENVMVEGKHFTLPVALLLWKEYLQHEGEEEFSPRDTDRLMGAMHAIFALLGQHGLPLTHDYLEGIGMEAHDIVHVQALALDRSTLGAQPSSRALRL